MKSLTKWSPFGGSSTYIDTDSVFSQMDSVFREVFSPLTDEEEKSSLSLFERAAYPRLDFRDEGNQFVVDIEVPGLTREDITAEIKNNVLIIRGEKRQDKEDKKGTYIRRELKRSSFSRQICELTPNCDVDKIEAVFTNGLMTITIPKKQVEPPKNDVKTIPIK